MFRVNGVHSHSTHQLASQKHQSYATNVHTQQPLLFACHLFESTVVHPGKEADAFQLILEVVQGMSQLLPFRVRIESDRTANLGAQKPMILP